VGTIALVGAASVLGPIIPPSIIMVVYASIANVSVGRMFLGGFGPGILAAALLMVLTSVIARQRDIPAGRRSSVGEIMGATRRAALVLVAPFIVIASTICWAVQCAVGCSVTLKWTTRRRWWASTRRTKSTRRPAVGTVKNSRATKLHKWKYWKFRFT
jgi:TRAP-type C4-dicarboxylate transport system permease large subunit